MLYIGTSGWQYRHWLGRFYPRKPRVDDDLAFYAESFATVELNGTFYRLPEAKTFADWRERTPEDFIFAVKASRFITHMKRLSEPREPVERMMSRATKLGAKLGPVLLQLPPTMRCDAGRLADVLDEFNGRARVAVEFRHDSWFTDEIYALLEGHDAALCLADRKSRMVTPERRTASWGYMRLHFGTASPPSCYGGQALASRAEMLARLYDRDDEVFAYFNNDGHGCAVRDAVVFAGAAERAGLRPSHVPDRESVHAA